MVLQDASIGRENNKGSLNKTMCLEFQKKKNIILKILQTEEVLNIFSSVKANTIIKIIKILIDASSQNNTNLIISSLKSSNF